MGHGNMGTRAIQNYTTLSQNERAQAGEERKQEDWEKDAPLRQVKRTQATHMQMGMDADRASYADDYDFAMNIKNRNDQERNMKMQLMQAKALKDANGRANINAGQADNATRQYGLSGSDKDLSNVAKHTSGNGQPDQNGYYSIGPMQMRPITTANMTPRQKQRYQQIVDNRAERVKGGAYKEETFIDGIKRFVNSVTGDVFSSDVWLEDEKGQIYSSQHINTITGQISRAGTTHQATTPQTKEEVVETPSQPAVETPSQPTPTTPSKSDTPLEFNQMDDTAQGKVYDDYAKANKDFMAHKDKTTISMEKMPKDSAGYKLSGELGQQGPDVDEAIISAHTKYSKEMASMKWPEFEKFYNSKETAQPAVGPDTTVINKEPELNSSLQTYIEKYTNEVTHNANLPKGVRTTPTVGEKQFMSIMNSPENLETAIKAGVTNERELHEWVEGKGKFKPLSPTEVGKQENRKTINSLVDRAYIKNDKGVKSFSMKSVADMDQSELSKAQMKLGKNTDLKKLNDAYNNTEAWYSSRDMILKNSSKRMELAKIGKSVALQSDKWLGTMFDGEDGASRYAELQAVMGKTVANQVKLMSGTAASDKERASIIRYMFGDAGVTEASFKAAMKGYSQVLHAGIPAQTEQAFNSKGFLVANKFARLHQKYKDEYKDGSKNSLGGKKTRLQMLKEEQARRKQGGE